MSLTAKTFSSEINMVIKYIFRLNEKYSTNLLHSNIVHKVFCYIKDECLYTEQIQFSI